ncbi:MAG: YHYH protein [Ignavibacteriae bacterium]|nr:YHYH protein [Ignavibacteriota bacterium]MCB9244348.1 YHYH protein [Ignavibacteriales bacterium]
MFQKGISYIFVLAILITGAYSFKDKGEDFTQTPSPGLHPCYILPGEYPKKILYNNVKETKVTRGGTSWRRIKTNSIPNHVIGNFPNPGYNPNSIKEINETYFVLYDPVKTGVVTELLDPVKGPQYEFGIAVNGIVFDPIAAEPWGKGRPGPDNYAYNLEAINCSYRLGLDCNFGHVQPNGQYHYHGVPTNLVDSLIKAKDGEMILLGYAADGAPVYYLYSAYFVYREDTSYVKKMGSPRIHLKMMNSGYKLRSGSRPGDGVSAPAGSYDGTYSSDYEYSSKLSDLDECNGIYGWTPEFGNIYYYVITEDFPVIPRCLKGTPSDDFKIGPP